jgi:hypothetical protein
VERAKGASARKAERARDIPEKFRERSVTANSDADGAEALDVRPNETPKEWAW